MPKVLSNGNEGANRLAVEQELARLDRDGELHAMDGPLVAQCRSLASAMDENPGSSQLAMQYTKALAELRKHAANAEERETIRVFSGLWTDCLEAHDDLRKYARGGPPHPQDGRGLCKTCALMLFRDETGRDWEMDEFVEAVRRYSPGYLDREAMDADRRRRMGMGDADLP